MKSTLHERLEEYSQYAEMKHLAYTIGALQRDKMFRSLAVLSFMPGEGKTLFCAALAIAYAEACGSKVLVVDTTSYTNKNSLLLKECFNGSTPLVELRSLKELRGGPGLAPAMPAAESQVIDPVVVSESPQNLTVAKESDFSVLKQVAEERSKGYGLVLLDTMPLLSRNKGNVDPLLVARLAEASVAITSRKFLDTSKLNECLKLLKDPTLHLIGLIANEEGRK